MWGGADLDTLNTTGRHALVGLAATAALLHGLAGRASAQGEITGRVVASDSGRLVVQGAEASIARIGRAAISDSSGRFRLTDIPPGEYLLVLRAIGFKAESTTVFIDRDEVVSQDIVLTRSIGTVLPERVVTAPEGRPPAKLVEFMERQRTGTGHFITREQLAKAEGGQRQTGDVISMIPGVRVRRGTNKIWVASGRAINFGKCAFCATAGTINQVDFAAGARPACYMDVYLDGVLVFDSRHSENGLFDVNMLQPEYIAGIEVYTSASQVPAKYNRTAGGCGVLLIWTR